jgi:hypothetical protein
MLSVVQRYILIVHYRFGVWREYPQTMHSSCSCVRLAFVDALNASHDTLGFFYAFKAALRAMSMRNDNARAVMFR